MGDLVTVLDHSAADMIEEEVREAQPYRVSQKMVRCCVVLIT